MTYDRFLESLNQAETPPAELPPELASLWLAKKDRWDEAHDIAQDIPTKMGYWIHGLLHAVEGDFSNSGYWYRKAGQAPVGADQIDAEWERLVRENLPG